MEDVVAVGDPIIVMVTDIDQQGRINLSRKDALAAIAKKARGTAAVKLREFCSFFEKKGTEETLIE